MQLETVLLWQRRFVKLIVWTIVAVGASYVLELVIPGDNSLFIFAIFAGFPLLISILGLIGMIMYELWIEKSLLNWKILVLIALGVLFFGGPLFTQFLYF